MAIQEVIEICGQSKVFDQGGKGEMYQGDLLRQPRKDYESNSEVEHQEGR
jgi:hypothetical protein